MLDRNQDILTGAWAYLPLHYEAQLFRKIVCACRYFFYCFACNGTLVGLPEYVVGSSSRHEKPV